MPRNDTFTGDFEVVHETDNAVLLKPEHGKQGWVPFSQIHEIHRSPNTRTARVVMSLWIAGEKGFV